MSNVKKRNTATAASNPSPAIAGAGEPQSAVEYELSMLEAELYGISDSLNTLRHRLEPVLSIQRPMEECCGVDSDTDCPLQQTIRDKRSLVSGHKEIICDLLERTQL